MHTYTLTKQMYEKELGLLAGTQVPEYVYEKIPMKNELRAAIMSNVCNPNTWEVESKPGL